MERGNSQQFCRNRLGCWGPWIGMNDERGRGSNLPFEPSMRRVFDVHEVSRCIGIRHHIGICTDINKNFWPNEAKKINPSNALDRQASEMATGDKFVDENRCGFRCLASAAKRTFGGPYVDRDQDLVSFGNSRCRVHRRERLRRRDPSPVRSSLAITLATKANLKSAFSWKGVR